MLFDYRSPKKASSSVKLTVPTDPIMVLDFDFLADLWVLSVREM